MCELLRLITEKDTRDDGRSKCDMINTTKSSTRGCLDSRGSEGC